MERDVPIKEIVVDMPVSETLVRSKMHMLQKDGLIQPLAIWQHGMLVIDGFHRLEAAKRLGWQTVRCSIIDVSEEQFWASRIDSAKQHHEVEKPRLLAWIRQCWQASEYAKSSDIAETLLRLRKKVGSDWEFSAGSQRGKLHLSDDDQAVLTWFDDHAARWSMSALDILETVVAELSGRKTANWKASGEINELATRRDLPLVQVVALHKAVGDGSVGDNKKDIPVKALERFVDAGLPEVKPLRMFAAEVQREEEDKESQERQAELERRSQEQRRYQERINGIVALSDMAQADMERRCESLLAWMNEKKTVLSAARQGREIVTRHMAALAKVASDLWPTDESAQAALAKLQEDARRRIELENRLPDVLVVHGTGSR